MFIAMNNFKVAEGRGPDFERAWRERESYLDGVPGFVQFALLRGAVEGEYVSHTTWRDRQSFVDWTNSPAFHNAHRQGSVAGLLGGPPQVKTYEAILVQTPAGRAVEAG